MEQSYTPDADYSGKYARIGIVSARFNGDIVEAMRAAAYDTLIENGVSEEDITSVHVPGALELPLACKTMAATKRQDGIIALGCVIRGGTPHFEYVCQGCTSGIQQISLETNVPIAFGVLTTDTVAQAQARASTDGTKENKGRYAALCVLEMINVIRTIDR